MWRVSWTVVVLKVLFFLRFDPQLDTPTNFGDVLYWVAYVREMIASEAFCHISRSFHKSIGPSNARLASFLAKNHQIWIIASDLSQLWLRSDATIQIWCFLFLPSIWNLALILQVWPAWRVNHNNPHNTLPVWHLAWSCKRLPRPTIIDATSARPLAHLCTEIWCDG
jgi:hypothetical protein